MNVTLLVDLVALGAAFRRGTTVTFAPTLAHLALALVEAGAAVEAA